MASVLRGSGDSSFGGNLSIEGVLTYEDVSSVDSVGVITARAGLVVTGGSIPIEVKSGSGEDSRIQFTRVDSEDANINAAWLGIPSWDTDGLYIYGPTSSGNEHAATYTESQWRFYTSGTEKLRVTSDGSVGINTTVTTDGPGTTYDILRIDQGGDDRGLTIANTVRGDRYTTFQLSGVTNQAFSILNYDLTNEQALATFSRESITFQTTTSGNSVGAGLVLYDNGSVTTPRSPYSQWKITCNTGTGVRTLTEYTDRASNLTSEAAGNGSTHGSVGRFTAPITGVYLFTITAIGGPASREELLVLYGSWTSSTTNQFGPGTEIIDTRSAGATGNTLQEDGSSTVFTLYLAQSDYVSLDWYRPNSTIYVGSTFYNVSVTLLG
tara:strand:+ start:457 stop:1599 length:1143 start_codon:yes stop_codon:yes gene_type:complete